MTVQAQLKWVDGLQFVARAGDGPAIVFDSGSGGSGPSPMEALLMSVAACTAMDVISILKKKRAPVERFEVNVTGERAEEHPKRYVKVHIEYVVYGRGVKPRDVERSIELSETKYCGAMASLNAEITNSYRIEE